MYKVKDAIDSIFDTSLHKLDEETLWGILNSERFIIFNIVDKSFLHFVKSHQIWILITLFRLIWHQTEFRLVLNESEKCYHDLNWV